MGFEKALSYYLYLDMTLPTGQIGKFSKIAGLPITLL
jgi:hypothetical protein